MFYRKILLFTPVVKAAAPAIDGYQYPFIQYFHQPASQPASNQPSKNAKARRRFERGCWRLIPLMTEFIYS
jgi:hypothetical protein